MYIRVGEKSPLFGARGNGFEFSCRLRNDRGAKMNPSKFTAGLLAASLMILVQTRPTPSQPPKADQHPLYSLPYSPSLNLTSMDRTADACVDFYQYVCGGWMKNNPI